MGRPVLTVAALRATEQQAARDLPAGELMQRAGRAVARAAIELARERLNRSEGLSICVVCGPGNNGGDGFIAATELRDAGHRVTCVRIAATGAPPADAAHAARRWSDAGGATLDTLPSRTRFDIVIDALLGIGATRPLADKALAAVAWINEQPLVLAVDVPSGLDAERGIWVGGIPGVRASRTITLIADKPGLHTADGVDAAGEVVLDGLNVEVSAADAMLSTPEDFAALLTPRRRNSHKGQFGNLAIVGGAESMVGAALLAARAGLRLGAGRVFVELLGAPQMQVDPLQPELMLRSVASLEEVDALVVGCGLGTDDRAQAALAAALARATPIVIDADGLTLLAGEDSLRRALAARSAPTVLTPHPLEAARLLRSNAASIQGDRLAAARMLAEQTRSVVILKGAGTVIGDGSRCAINPTGSPALATAGSGDVLAGMLGALLAQRYAPWEAALAAVWLHGRTADAIGDVGLVAGDIAPAAVTHLRALRAGFTR